MESFIMNGQLWNVRFTNPNNPVLVDRTNTFTIAVTDPSARTIYIADNLHGELLTKVILHELSHVMMYAYGYLDEIHKYCKRRYWIPMEELIANLIANRAREIFERAYEIVGGEAIRLVPYALERTAA